MSKRTLRITQETDSPGEYRVRLALQGEGLVPQEAVAKFTFELNSQHREDLRWYLEDYLQYPQDPAPKVAARIEKDINDLGIDLFKKVFQSGDDTRDLWAMLRQKLDDTRVEVNTSVAESASIPWELIRDPKTDEALALRADCFVRSHTQATQQPELLQTESGPIRILLVICRPGGDDDVPFRSVATQLIKGLGDQAEDRFQLDVLRPATFQRLAWVLREAKAAGKPYHVVHFDGHGMFAKTPAPDGVGNWLKRLGAVMLSGPRIGQHGYLLFERPDDESNAELIDGPTLGSLLVETDAHVLVLNACRSAHAEAPDKPEAAAGDDVHEQVRAFGSLAQEVMDAGVGGVVAMRYNVYVVTAAQFVADMYQTLVQGRSLGESVSMGRKQLAAQPNRTISFDPRPLQDWSVPLVYEAAPIQLFPKRASDEPKITIRSGGSATDRGSLDRSLPRPPDVGFFGRDETLLALDRAFDTHSIVLLHAYAGSGKTSTAAEFARWYSQTGGVDGPVLFTSFETYRPLPRALDKIGEVFGQMLEKAGIHWLTLDDNNRRDIALQVLQQIPVLWVWDNVEPIAGLTADDKTYTPLERQALADFLRDAKLTKAKILLTSRRDERAWLIDLPTRIKVPPMPMQERVQLARALAERHGKKLTAVDDWRPLLRFTQGNPLTITVLVGQALRDGRHTREQIEAFVDSLRMGEAAFGDEVEQGRTRSLGASLQYGFEHAFSDHERKILALLAMFQGFVDVDVLRVMGTPDAEWSLPELRGATRESLIALLDRAADVGLLMSYIGGYYTIHPALPWFFSGMFVNSFYSQPSDSDPQLRAFVEAMGLLGNLYHDQYGIGKRQVISVLSAEEANLLHARRLARSHGWWHRVTSVMQGLRMLYVHTGRHAVWRRLVEEIVPDFVALPGNGPLPNREEQWYLVSDYRVRLAAEARQWDMAERLQQALVDWNRQRAEVASGINLQPNNRRRGEAYPTLQNLDGPRRNDVRSLLASLQALGSIQREQEKSDCLTSFEESLAIAEAMNDRVLTAICAFNIGRVYAHVPALCDLVEGEKWYRKSLGLFQEEEPDFRAKCWGEIGWIALFRVRICVRENGPEAELLADLNTALQSSNQALDLLSAGALTDLATTHHQLGTIYGYAGDIDRALHHYRESIRLREASANVYDASGTRFNVSRLLLGASRLSDAREYALAALRGYESSGDSASDDIADCQRLLTEIDQAIQEQPK